MIIEEEDEDKFFYNKHLTQDMGQASEDILENEKSVLIKRRNISGSITPNDCDIDSVTDKSLEHNDTFNIPKMNFHNYDKKNSFTSLCNFASMDERMNRSKSRL